jgi:hypothetical protein
LREGKVWIISEGRFQKEGGKSKEVELWDDLGKLVKTFKYISECGKFLSISPTSVSKLIKKAAFLLCKKKFFEGVKPKNIYFINKIIFFKRYFRRVGIPKNHFY